MEEQVSGGGYGKREQFDSDDFKTGAFGIGSNQSKITFSKGDNHGMSFGGKSLGIGSDKPTNQNINDFTLDEGLSSNYEKQGTQAGKQQRQKTMKAQTKHLQHSDSGLIHIDLLQVEEVKIEVANSDKPIIERLQDGYQQQATKRQMMKRSSRSVYAGGVQINSDGTVPGTTNLPLSIQQNQKSTSNSQQKSNGIKPQSGEEDDDDTISKQEQARREKEIAEELEKDILSEQERYAQKVSLVKNGILKKQIWMIVTTFVLISTLSVYFIISYFLSLRTFNTASTVISDLERIFYKGSCLDQTLNFLREIQIRNETITVRNSGMKVFGQSNIVYQPAVDYYMEFCGEKDRAYQKMRKNMPSYFKDAQTYIEQLDSDQICDNVFTGSLVKFNERCKTAINGIMNQGLSNGLSHMYTQILKANLHYTEVGPTANRSVDFLSKEIANSVIIQIIDFKADVLDSIFEKLKVICMNSVIDYVSKLLNDFLIAYIAFVVVLTLAIFAMVFVEFKKLKKKMFDSNIVLRIIPYQQMSKQDRQEINQFFVN